MHFLSTLCLERIQMVGGLGIQDSQAKRLRWSLSLPEAASRRAPRPVQGPQTLGTTLVAATSASMKVMTIVPHQERRLQC